MLTCPSCAALAQVEQLRAAGLIKGGSMDNALVCRYAVAWPVIRARHSLSMLWVTYPTSLAHSTPPIRMAAGGNSSLRFLATQTDILRYLCLSILSVMCPTDFISRGCAFSQDGGWLNPPLRFDDEPCRHKLVDLIGDLALCNVDGD